ncbi:MAG: hypothetical protein N4A57_10575 [Anaeromicrobium sp.]|uniref:hypothetical protein n=1 Tax=Anaeromicrobium sp. TaxID=1929132 RepID=UPI0025F7C884|nr:hypothetical protein [Anaeromicrobium sp.]MCT4594695.1 hypothetical protein [Anaeromicrobium sp.]
MTQKSRKGIVGKKIPTTNHRQNVGSGISFTAEHVVDSKEINALLDRQKAGNDLK